ncbi:MAG: serine/threonine-protein kinase [Verrucomicrobiota bacterium]
MSEASYFKSSGRYQPIKPLGEGGVGSVFVALDTQLNREVALKRLKNAADFEAIMREAQILASLSHPNIVSVYDFGVDEEGAYVVMELIKGKMVNHWASKNPIPLSLFREFADQSLQGLALAHNQGLIHRDIKPQNIMIDYDGKKVLVKLLDFGLAESTRLPGQEEEAGTVMGSVHTIAPEQLVGEPATALTDIYSLACVYYYSLTGHYPFEGNSVEAIVQGHLQGTVMPLNQRRPAIPPLLAQVIGRMLSRNPAERPESAEKAREQILAITKSPAFHEKDFGLKQFVAKSSTGTGVGKIARSTEVIDVQKLKRRAKTIQIAWAVNAVVILCILSFLYFKYFKA